MKIQNAKLVQIPLYSVFFFCCCSCVCVCGGSKNKVARLRRQMMLLTKFNWSRLFGLWQPRLSLLISFVGVYILFLQCRLQKLAHYFPSILFFFFVCTYFYKTVFHAVFGAIYSFDSVYFLLGGKASFFFCSCHC